ncbi:hypothetical protein [Agrobacterium larrymoorei]|uniref:hypothetical protein n=1 Tax=Agrobacterium larrymoorei TaxID=160699 RepID=UPI0030C44D29
MAFIHLNRTNTNNKVSINVTHIVSVQPGNPDTIVQTAVPYTGGGLQYLVSDSYDAVLKMIETAQVYGPR